GARIHHGIPRPTISKPCQVARPGPVPAHRIAAGNVRPADATVEAGDLPTSGDGELSQRPAQEPRTPKDQQPHPTMMPEDTAPGGAALLVWIPLAETVIDLVGTIGRLVLDNLLPARRLPLNQRTVKRAISKYNARGPNIDRRTYK